MQPIKWHIFQREPYTQLSSGIGCSEINQDAMLLWTTCSELVWVHIHIWLRTEEIEFKS